MIHEFIPKAYFYLRSGYNFSIFRKDLLAGITVGIIALPLAMAFAIASGVSPERGLITAIIAGFLISALGGSRIQIGGPTGAFVVLIYDIVQRTGYEGLALSTLLGAILLILFGIFRLGSWIKYVPHPLIMGFTTGIAVIIFSSQIKDFFGLSMGTPPADFFAKWAAYIRAFPSLQWPTFLLGGGTLLLIILIRRFIPRLPWGIASITVATLCFYVFNIPTPTIASTFGNIPNHLPWPSLPNLSIPEGKLIEICFDAIAIAFLGGIESLLSAVVGDGMIGGRHKSNCELIGQGIANFASIVFGGIPATGAIARTAANIKSGAQTPVSGMIHAITLFFIVFFFAPIVSQIPLAALSAVLIVIAWNMSEYNHFINLLKAPIGDVAVLLTAFLLTVFVDITIAITFGMILASFLFMKRMSQISKIVSLKPLFQEPQEEFPEKKDPASIADKKIPSDIEIYEIQGPLFFGAADILKNVLSNLEKPPKIFILRMRYISFIDASGMQALQEFHQNCQKQKTLLLLSEIHSHAEKDLKKFGLLKLIGKERIYPTLDSALKEGKRLGC
jgi:SulP family sulfate permease